MDEDLQGDPAAVAAAEAVKAEEERRRMAAEATLQAELVAEMAAWGGSLQWLPPQAAEMWANTLAQLLQRCLVEQTALSAFSVVEFVQVTLRAPPRRRPAHSAASKQ